MLTVHLHNLVFHGYHGLYEGENRTGNDFEVNLDVAYQPKKDELHTISRLISYEDLYHLVRKKMMNATPLLEELAINILDRIHDQYPQVKKIRISIYKMNVPIESFEGKAGITLEKEYK